MFRKKVLLICVAVYLLINFICKHFEQVDIGGGGPARANWAAFEAPTS